MTRWNEKAVLVTGGSAGLGLAIAQAFGRAGARVMIIARDAQRLEQAVVQLRAAGINAVGRAADVTSDDDVRQMIEHAVASFGRLDVLVNCAGRSMRGLLADTPVERFAELLELNFLSAVRCTRAAVPHLLAARGHVVQIGSLSAKTSSPYLGAYAASKFPLAAYAQQLRLEYGQQGLHTLLVCPGPIQREDAGQRYDSDTANLPDSARRPGGGAKLTAIDPAWLAGRIVRACEKRSSELIVPRSARLLFAISQLSPWLGDWILRKKT